MGTAVRLGVGIPTGEDTEEPPTYGSPCLGITVSNNHQLHYKVSNSRHPGQMPVKIDDLVLRGEHLHEGLVRVPASRR